MADPAHSLLTWTRDWDQWRTRRNDSHSAKRFAFITPLPSSSLPAEKKERERKKELVTLHLIWINVILSPRIQTVLHFLLSFQTVLQSRGNVPAAPIFFLFSLLSCLPCILEPPSLLSFLYPTSSCLNIQCGFGHEMVQREFCVPEIPERHSYSPEVGREMFAVLVDSGDVLSTFMLTILFTFPSPLESSVYAFILCPFHADLCVRD